MAMGVREEEILRSALKGSRRDLSRLLSLIESGQDINVHTQDSWTLGVTGPPGSGKSSLIGNFVNYWSCLLYTSPSPRDKRQSRMPSSA